MCVFVSVSVLCTFASCLLMLHMLCFVFAYSLMCCVSCLFMLDMLCLVSIYALICCVSCLFMLDTLCTKLSKPIGDLCQRSLELTYLHITNS